MKVVELFLDSFLRQFQLFLDAETLLKAYNTDNPIGEDTELDEVQALNLFNDFVNLAKLLYTYSSWTSKEWTNFLMFMVQAFKEKGRAIAVNCVLAALGISTTTPVTVVDAWVKEGDPNSPSVDIPEGGTEGWEFKSIITMEIETLNTPIVDRFISDLEDLLPRLLWLHDTDTSSSVVNQVLVEINLSESYEKYTYTKSIYYSEPTLV